MEVAPLLLLHDDILEIILRKSQAQSNRSYSLVCTRFRNVLLKSKARLTLTHDLPAGTLSLCSALSSIEVAPLTSPFELINLKDPDDVAVLSNLKGLIIAPTCIAQPPHTHESVGKMLMRVSLHKISARVSQQSQNAVSAFFTPLLKAVRALGPGLPPPPPPPPPRADAARPSLKSAPATPLSLTVFASLRSLVLDGWKGVDDSLMLEVAKLGSLERLSMQRCRRLTDVGLRHLRPLRGSLRELSIAGCLSVTDGGIVYLAGQSSLRSLDVAHCAHITFAGLCTAAELPQLVAVDASGFSGVSEVCELFARCREFQRLTLSECSPVLGDALYHPSPWQVLPAWTRRLTFSPALVHLSLRRCSYLTDASLVALGSLSMLTHLDVSGCERLADHTVAHVSVMTDLRHLDLAECRHVTDAGLRHLLACRALTFLDLASCREVSDDGLSCVAQLPALASLNLSECWKLTDAGVAGLGALTGLTFLDLHMCTNVTDEAFATLTGLVSLQRLVIDSCTGLTDTALRHVARLPALQRLSMKFCKEATPAGLAAVARRPTLTHLDVSYCNNWALHPGAFDGLPFSARLREVTFEGCNWVQDRFLRALSQLTALTSLTVGHLVRDEGLQCLANLRCLRTLSLADCRHVTSRGLQPLSELRQLSELKLAVSRRLRDKGLAHLAPLAALERLEITQGRCVTDAGVHYLEGLTLLTHLSLNACSRVTDGALARLTRLTHLESLVVCGCARVSVRGLVPLACLPFLESVDLTGCYIGRAELASVAPLPAHVTVVL